MGSFPETSINPINPGFSNVCEAVPRLNDPEMRFGFPFILIDKSTFNRPIMARTQILVHRWGRRATISQLFCLNQSLVSSVAHSTNAAATHLFSNVFILQGLGKIRNGSISRLLFCSTCVMFLHLFFFFQVFRIASCLFNCWNSY